MRTEGIAGGQRPAERPPGAPPRAVAPGYSSVFCFFVLFVAFVVRFFRFFPLRPEFSQPFRVGHCQRHEIHRGEMAQAALQRLLLAERRQTIGPACLGTKSVGTGCQLWLANRAGVLWSPVTINTIGFSATMRA